MENEKWGVPACVCWQVPRALPGGGRHRRVPSRALGDSRALAGPHRGGMSIRGRPPQDSVPGLGGRTSQPGARPSSPSPLLRSPLRCFKSGAVGPIPAPVPHFQPGFPCAETCLVFPGYRSGVGRHKEGVVLPPGRQLGLHPT